MAISVIKKRDGRIVPFDVKKISNAIQKSFVAGEPDRDHEALADSLAWEVYSLLDLEGDPAPTVEHVQDVVEQVLMRDGYGQTAKSYILYRQERTNIRNREPYGRGTITVAPPEKRCNLAEQALCIYRVVRDNGGCELLKGFYSALAPGVEGSYAGLYDDFLRLACELLAGVHLGEQPLRAIDAALAAEGLRAELGENAAYLARQADLLCEELGCERAPLEAAQAAAVARAADAVKRRTQRTLRTLLYYLDCAGCSREAIAPEAGSGVALRLLQDTLR